jgi:hypothetical protein
MELKEIFALVDYLVDEKLSEINLPQGKKGLRGPRGRDGEDFNWDSSKDKIEKYVIENSLTFEKLTEDQKKSLTGERGLRGHKGDRGDRGLPGENFSWELYQDKIFQRIDQNKLKFSELSDEEKLSLKGEKGFRGQRGKIGEKGEDGKDFVWEDHMEKISKLISHNKIKFSDLS